MVRFPSSEWAAAFERALNSNEEYRRAAAAWEGEILLRVVPPAATAPAPGILLDLHRGSCRSATFQPDSRTTESEFAFEGDVRAWAQLMSGAIDPVTALLGGAFKLRGNLAKAMRFTRAANELVRTAAQLPDTRVDG